LILASAVFFGFGFQADCQKADLGPYVKYNSDADVPRITLEDAKKEYDNGTAVIIDARGEDAFKQEHVKGSLNIPIGSPESRFSEIPKGKNIIVYCS
jgi:hypothetical protein